MEEEWVTVQNRKRSRRSRYESSDENNHWNNARPFDRSKRSDFDRLMKSTATTYFFTHFPDSWGTTALWRMFEKYGHIADLYITKNRTVHGERFGFVRFLKVASAEAFQRKLSEIRIGYEKLLINVTRYEKGRTEEVQKNEKVKVDQASSQTPFHFRQPYKTYKEAVKDKKLEEQRNVSESSNSDEGRTRTQGVKIDVNDDVFLRFKKCLVAEAKCFETLQNIWNILKEEGICENKIRYIGRMSILIECDSENAALELLRNSSHGLHHWLVNIRKWEASNLRTGRLVWVKLEGIPLHAWCEDVSKVIAGPCGEVIVVERMHPLCLSPSTGGLKKSFVDLNSDGDDDMSDYVSDSMGENEQWEHWPENSPPVFNRVATGNNAAPPYDGVGPDKPNDSEAQAQGPSDNASSTAPHADAYGEVNIVGSYQTISSGPNNNDPSPMDPKPDTTLEQNVQHKDVIGPSDTDVPISVHIGDDSRQSNFVRAKKSSYPTPLVANQVGGKMSCHILREGSENHRKIKKVDRKHEALMVGKPEVPLKSEESLSHSSDSSRLKEIGEKLGFIAMIDTNKKDVGAKSK
ncbi:nucleotide-binding alpha-beta plait domain-containing protein [Tanacetum coccineum]